ncbi:MAG: PAS domain S-box protein, partial [Acidobacteriaceae bacterium]|nr:PAS domain S-box protein [Acidobacteriaceae bacterium]
MSWITITWSMMVSAYLTLAAIHLIIWLKQTDQRAHLLFSMVAISVAVIAAVELLIMRASSPEQLGNLIWWAHIPVFSGTVSIVGFVRLYFNAGRPWLGYTACGLRLLDLIINFFSTPNSNYKQITGLLHLTWGGETISVARGIENPWVKISELSSLFVLLFMLDASITLWRRGNRTERRRALLVGGSMIFFILVAAGHSALVEAGLIQSPYLISLSFLPIVIAMSYRLGSDVVHAARLARQLQASKAAMGESEKRFRILADTAPVMVWMSGIDMLCNFFSKPWFEFTGRTLEQELGNGWSEGVHPEDLQGCLDTYVRSFNARQPFTMEYRLRRADREYRWVLDTGVPRYTSEGEFAGYIGSCIDITERRGAEEALRESERQMGLAASAAGLAMWTWDIPRDEVWTTGEGRSLFGFEQSEKINFARFLDALHPEDREDGRKAIAEAVKGAGGFEKEYRVLLPTGETRWIAARGQVDYNGTKPVRMRGVSFDITVRKQAQDRFRLVVEASPNGIVLVNAQGRIVLVNAGAEKLFTYRREELIGQSMELLMPERFRDRHLAHRTAFNADPIARAMGVGLELYARRKDGTEFPVETGISPIESPEGTLVLSVIVDISVRKQAEAGARQYREELAHLSRVAIMGEIAGSLAHELNQPLTGVVNNASAGRRFIAKGRADLPKLDSLLEAIAADGHRAGEILRGIRHMVRKGEEVRGPVNLNDVINSVLRFIRSEALERQCVLGVQTDPKLPLVEA